MTTSNNAVNTSLIAQSGTGAFAGSTSATFVTPTLGVSSATSINFGGGALSTYTATNTFVPTFTFAVPGDLSVAYTVQLGSYVVIGSLVIVQVALSFTPTFTTASGQAHIGSLPITANASINLWPGNLYSSGVTYPFSSYTSLIPTMPGSVNYFVLYAIGPPLTAITQMNASSFTSGTAIQLNTQISYFS
jgi:hypothetical protein